MERRLAAILAADVVGYMGAFLHSPLRSGWVGPREAKAHGMAGPLNR
jgi:hypothetical protein